jgi:hypothetical protein
VCGLPKGTLK